MLKKLFLILFILGGFLVCNNIAHAGFGISPPYVKPGKPVFPGTHYEQRIMLLRSAADEDLQASIQIIAPEIDSWISIEQGNLFDLPNDQLKIPMIVRVDVPPDADIGEYKGYINIRIVPKNERTSGGVAIALGARVDIDLTVTDESFLEFLVRKVDIIDFEQFDKPWNWRIFAHFFYRIKVAMNIENTGNVKIAPSKVHIDVYDLTEKKLLESHDDKSLKKVKPFETEKVVASFPTKLGPGEYWGKISVYKDKDIVYKDKLIFNVFPKGGLEGGGKMGIWPWIMLGAIIILIIIIIGILIKIKFWKYIYKLIYIVSWPLRYLWKKLIELINKLKVKFWKWMHKKASKYSNDDSHK